MSRGLTLNVPPLASATDDELIVSEIVNAQRILFILLDYWTFINYDKVCLKNS